jgi:hypothetical protein
VSDKTSLHYTITAVFLTLLFAFTLFSPLNHDLSHIAQAQYDTNDTRIKATTNNETSINFSFNYTHSVGPVGSIKNKTVSYNSDINELVFSSKTSAYTKNISDLDEDNLKKIINGNNFFNLPSSFPILEIFANYSSYNLTVIMDGKTHIVNLVDREFSPNVPVGLYNIADAINKISAPTHTSG